MFFGRPKNFLYAQRKSLLGVQSRLDAKNELFLDVPKNVLGIPNIFWTPETYFRVVLYFHARRGQADGKDKHTRLWIHEVFRVFGDRLINDADRLTMLEIIAAIDRYDRSIDSIDSIHRPTWPQTCIRRNYWELEIRPLSKFQPFTTL